MIAAGAPFASMLLGIAALISLSAGSCEAEFADPGVQLEADLPAPAATSSIEDTSGTLLDRSRQDFYEFLWHGARRVDRWFGSGTEDAAYQHLYGSVSVAQLWDQHYGLRDPLRFNVNLPLPLLNERLHAFVGRLDPNEYVTETDEPSGAFRRQVGPPSEDQTLVGLDFQGPPKSGGNFVAGAGIHVSLPLNPYLKGSYIYSLGDPAHGWLTVRETAFWERVQGAGITVRADIERLHGGSWMTRWTTSATFSQTTRGAAAWSAVQIMHGISDRKAVIAEVELDGQSDAAVPLHSYGAQMAYRQSILRSWLIVELRASLSWPKESPQMLRKTDPGIGLGLEMLFGTNRFLARPVTF